MKPPQHAKPVIRIIDAPEELEQVEILQRLVWPGNETEIVPTHMLRAVIHNGGLVIGAFLDRPEHPASTLIGFVFGFPGYYHTPDGPRLKHCSHMLGIHPDYRDEHIGFTLKRAQWQMVRHQQIDRITWTYDPLLSRNAYLNITKLGAVCNRYYQDYYGVMRDELNTGLPTDRLEVDWWVNSKRVERRLSRHFRRPLVKSDFEAADALIIHPLADINSYQRGGQRRANLILVEIPADYQALKSSDPQLSLGWRMATRSLFTQLFEDGYLITDFIHQPGADPQSFYAFSHGEATF